VAAVRVIVWRGQMSSMTNCTENHLPTDESRLMLYYPSLLQEVTMTGVGASFKIRLISYCIRN